jgi:hypothetical protein
MTAKMTAEEIVDAAAANPDLGKKKSWARRLVRDHGFTQHAALDLIAQREGHRNWALLSVSIENRTPVQALSSISSPISRIPDHPYPGQNRELAGIRRTDLLPRALGQAASAALKMENRKMNEHNLVSAYLNKLAVTCLGKNLVNLVNLVTSHRVV